MDMKSQEYKDYCAETRALMPINSEEKAKQYRAIWEKYYKINAFTGAEIK